MHETDSSLSEAKIKTYAKKIASSFAKPKSLVWKKGKELSSYTDWEKGYQLQLLVRSKSEGKSLVNNILDIQNHSPDWSKFNHQENDQPSKAYPTLPERQTILGKARKKPRRRPIADVRFQYAILKLWGLPNPIPLVDRSGIFLDPIERVV